MSARPSSPLRLRQAGIAALIAPSIVGAIGLAVMDPGAGILVAGPTLGAAMALLLGRTRGGPIPAGVLFLVAGFGAFMTFAIGLGMADSGTDMDRSTGRMAAFGPAMYSFLVALPASLVLAVIHRSRRPDRNDPPSIARPGRTTPVGISAVPLTIGAYVGYASAYPWTTLDSLDDLGRVLVLIPGTLLTVGLAFLFVVAGIVSQATGGARVRRVGRLAIGGGGILGLATLGGFLATPVLGIWYAAPFVGFGSATARFESEPPFKPDRRGYTECHSVAGTAASSVYAEVGWVGSDVLRVLFFQDVEGPDLYFVLPHGYGPRHGPSEIVYVRDAAVYVARSSLIREIESLDRGMSGRVTFDLPPVAPDQGNADWPAKLSGELAWSCGRWLGPAAAETVRGAGRLDLQLHGTDRLDWIPSSAMATCDFEAGRSVRFLWAESSGLLKGESVEVSVDLRAEHTVGSEVDAWIEVTGTDPPPDQPLPWWQARVRLIEIADGERVGRAAFNEMPSGGPASAGWPDALTGEITWSCG